MTNPAIDIAVIGGGFSGMMACYHLAHTATAPCTVTLFDPAKNVGRGLAYGTTNTHHLLNVRAKGMSALPDKPAHFLDWLNSPAGRTAARALHLGKIAWLGDDFAPRALYARYLDALWQEALATAQSRGITLLHKPFSVKRISATADGYAITTADDKVTTAAQCIMALGNLPQAAATDNTGDRLIDHVWAADLTTIAQNAGNGPVAIIGTGLTMIDMVISLRDAGYHGKIIGLSRNGLLPLRHDAPQAPYASRAATLSTSPQRLSTLMHAFRIEARQNHWQAVMDQWRPYLTALWAKLPALDKARFLSRHFTRWNIHRHRMAPAIADIVDAEIAKGTLVLRHGNVRTHATVDGVDIRIGDDTLKAAYALDCRGPGYDLRRAQSPLLVQMMQDGILMSHPTGWGIEVDEDLQAKGHRGLYVIGPLAIGARLETTAVPELRQQSAAVAARIRTG